jgi:glycosyltransferase involved in cell wall biosynthesis
VTEGVAKEKLKVVPYGVDLQTFWPSAEAVVRERFEVVYAGQLTQRKGISYLLRGYQQFQRRDSRLTIIGSTVEGMTPFLPYRELFRHVPHLTRPALAEMYRQSDVFVFPTLVEGMPLVVLEAMACGLPVIVTANGPGDLVRDGIDGFIVPQRDPDSISNRLERLYQDRELCRAMGQNARQRALEFGWERYAMQTREYLGQLIIA